MPDIPPEVPEQHDPVIERIADSLRVLPTVDAEARARVLVAVAAERERAPLAATQRGAWRRFTIPVAIAAALLLGVALRQHRSSRGAALAPVPVAADVGAATALPAARDEVVAELAGVAVQLVVHAPGADRVAVVGDFTGWDDQRISMTRDSASGLWSATVVVRPGRHVYAFVVDDSIWMRDPRAPVATDADFGRPGSLLLVGRP